MSLCDTDRYRLQSEVYLHYQYPREVLEYLWKEMEMIVSSTNDNYWMTKVEKKNHAKKTY